MTSPKTANSRKDKKQDDKVLDLLYRSLYACQHCDDDTLEHLKSAQQGFDALMSQLIQVDNFHF